MSGPCLPAELQLPRITEEFQQDNSVLLSVWPGAASIVQGGTVSAQKGASTLTPAGA